MHTRDRITLNQILKHKQHFDQRLIDIVNTFDSSMASMASSKAKLERDFQTSEKKCFDMQSKIKDLVSQNHTLTKKYKEEQKEKDEILEYLKKIQNELNELQKDNEKQIKEIDKQKKEIIKQGILIDKMKHMNSTNSNLPSSMDILGRTKARAEANTRVKTDKKRGGQKNHPLHKSRITANADRVITVKVKKAPTGATPFYDDKGKIKYYVTQEVDLILKSTITETRYYIEAQGKELDKDILARYAINPLIYSGDFKAATVYLNQKGTIPLQRLCDIMQDISEGSIQLHPGTISEWCQECHRKSKDLKEEIVRDILSFPIVHVDETGMKVNGEQYWIHVLTNEKGTSYLITKSRGDKENGPVKLLEFYAGVVVHDHFSTYQQLQLCKHAECNAHIDRYLQSGIDFDHNEECKEMVYLLHEMLRTKHRLIEEGKVAMPDSEIKSYEEKYTEILERGLKKYESEHPKIEKRYEPDFVKTFRRMLEFKADHLLFINNFLVPYTNNNAEIACRAVKGKKNISKQFITERGGDAYVSILSILQTAKIKKENALEALERLFH